MVSRPFSRYKLFNRYFCCNCGHWFRTGCYTKEEECSELKELYDDICPRCGADANEWWICFAVYWDKIKGKL